MKAKLSKIVAVGIALLTALTVPMLAQQRDAKRMPLEPVGWVDAYPEIVQAGSRPMISWGINEPISASNLAEISGNSTIVAKREFRAEIRILGNGVTAHRGDGKIQTVAVETFVSFNGGSYVSIFSGKNEDVNANNIAWENPAVQPAQSIRFGAQYIWGDTRGRFYSSGDGTQNIRIMRNGDTPPPYSGLVSTSPAISEFVKPFLDAGGRISIGPMDVLILMELTHDDTQHMHVGYDLQDMVLLMTMKRKSHNRSGLADGTNPGQGKQMGNNDGTLNPNQAK